MIAKLALENGTILTGTGFGAEGEITGEVVFNTSMTGYQEILTDPSYAGQIVTMTYPMIGSYGVNFDDMESVRPQVAGFVVREYIDFPSNFRSKGTLGKWLAQHGIVGVEGIDTRMLTKMIRTQGALRGVLSTVDLDDANLLAKAKASPRMVGLDLTKKVTTEKPYAWDEVDRTPFALIPQMKKLRNGQRRKVLEMDPDGIFLSNGPGDPAAVKYAIENIKKLVGKKPIFGICLGHQLLALALGGKTFKLKFGHRGANHPVKNLLTGDIEITSQNHGFAVDPDSLNPSDIEITHVNLNDGTNEGFRHRSLPLFCVQYHPEASPGPHDSDYLFSQFVEMIEGERLPASNARATVAG
jgi:carbamoyl-phosphate synthase small subunit